MKHQALKTLLRVSIFSVAMGYLESSVVVYLREIYYPDGFAFPLKIIPHDLAITELFRELATIIMLVVIGVLAGRTKTEKFAYFIYSFGIWDICYYVFLKALLNWPESLMTWDILFLIPTTWVGPVVAPVINSVTMILLALILIWATSACEKTKLNSAEWMLLMFGSFIVIIAYTMDYISYISVRFSFTDIFSAGKNQEVINYASAYIPRNFNWYVFFAGVFLHMTALLLFLKRVHPCFRKISQS